jgi:cytochrome b561
VSPTAWIACTAWIAAAAAAAAIGARRGLEEGRGRRAAARLKSPTIYLFTAYLVVAGLVTPVSRGESASPLLGLGVVLPAGYALATLSAIGREKRGALASLGLAILHGGAVLAAAVLVLAVASPGFVPAVLR